MTQAECARNHEWFGLDTYKGQGSISGKAVEARFKCLINSDIFLNLAPEHGKGYGMTVPVQIVNWAIRINTNSDIEKNHLDGCALVQWQFKPKHGEGTVWIDSTSDEYSVISSALVLENFS